MARAHSRRGILAPLAALATLSACSQAPHQYLRPLAAHGDFAQAAARLEATIQSSRANRDYLLDRLSLGLLLLADGRPHAAEGPLLEVFDSLRTQGINDDKTVASAVLGEQGVLFWKGEPFEQALAYIYIAQQRAMRSEWDNARAAAASSLFLLKDFGANERGNRRSTLDIAQEALKRESQPNNPDYLDKGYTPTKTNFALGYLITGIANLAMAQGDPAREDEARDNLREAFTLAPDLKPVADALITRRANTVILVEYGLGPRKVPYGPDNALARFEPTLPSDSRMLQARVDAGRAIDFPLACDINQMATDHSWNNLEDVRLAKSAVGQAMIAAGAITAVASRNDTGRWVGLGLVLGGLLARATAQADTRFLQLAPQRIYLAALYLPPATGIGATVELQIAGDHLSRLVLPGVTGPDPGQTLKMYGARLPLLRSPPPPQWAYSGIVRYANDSYAGTVPGDDLPYILGGRCVRRPSDHTLTHYQHAGFLTDMTLADLENLYRLEGIEPGDRPPTGHDGLHILEGGRRLDPPTPGSAGFARLFCAEHPPYTPRSREVAALSRRIEQQIAQRTPPHSPAGAERITSEN